MLEEYHDRLSADQLDAIGVGEGWRCLDVGAGAGSVTWMLAERVGTTGSVLSVDLDTTLLEELASDRVEVRRQDLMSDQLSRDSFDLIHARLVLMFFHPDSERYSGLRAPRGRSVVGFDCPGLHDRGCLADQLAVAAHMV